jgi:Haloacid dehalogenase-like hydrolase
MVFACRRRVAGRLPDRGRVRNNRLSAIPGACIVLRTAACLQMLHNEARSCIGSSWRECTAGIKHVLPCAQGKKLFFVTNNSTKSREGYLGKFTKLGLKISAEEIYSSSYAAAAYLESISFPQDKKVKTESNHVAAPSMPRWQLTACQQPVDLWREDATVVNPSSCFTDTVGGCFHVQVYIIGDVGIQEEMDLLGIQHTGGPSDNGKVVELKPGYAMPHDKDVRQSSDGGASHLLLTARVPKLRSAGRAVQVLDQVPGHCWRMTLQPASAGGSGGRRPRPEHQLPQNSVCDTVHSGEPRVPLHRDQPGCCHASHRCTGALS